MVFLRYVTFEKGYKQKIASSFFKICIILSLIFKKGYKQKIEPGFFEICKYTFLMWLFFV